MRKYNSLKTLTGDNRGSPWSDWGHFWSVHWIFDHQRCRDHILHLQVHAHCVQVMFDDCNKSSSTCISGKESSSVGGFFELPLFCKARRLQRCQPPQPDPSPTHRNSQNHFIQLHLRNPIFPLNLKNHIFRPNLQNLIFQLNSLVPTKSKLKPKPLRLKPFHGGTEQFTSWCFKLTQSKDQFLGQMKMPLNQNLKMLPSLKLKKCLNHPSRVTAGPKCPTWWWMKTRENMDQHHLPRNTAPPYRLLLVLFLLLHSPTTHLHAE